MFFTSCEKEIDTTINLEKTDSCKSVCMLQFDSFDDLTQTAERLNKFSVEELETWCK